MNVNAVLQAYAAPAFQASAPAKPPAKGAGEGVSVPRKAPLRDIVEISSEGQRRLARVQGRIDAGYYNSPAVTADITDKLSKVLDEIT